MNLKSLGVLVQTAAAISGIGWKAVGKFRQVFWNNKKLEEEYDEQIDELRKKKDTLEKHLIKYIQEIQDEPEDDDDVKEFVNDIRNKVYETQDVIDTHISKKKIKQYYEKNKKEMLYGYLIGSKYLEKLKLLNKKIVETILDNKSMIGKITTIKGSSQQQQQPSLKKGSSSRSKKLMVVFKKEEAEVVRLLTQGQKKLDTISIVGMGGIGKSTFARQIFKSNKKIGHHFKCCLAWVDATRNFKEPHEFLLSIYRYISGDQEANLTDKGKSTQMDENQLKEMISTYLNGKRYLIVIDDVWFSEDSWKKIRQVFPDENNGSRILLTSRSCGIGRALYLPFLDKHESWQLFSQEALLGPNNKVIFLEDRSRIEKLGILIALGCGGLPASIVVIANILADKEYDDWWKFDERRIKDHLYDREKQPLELIFSSSYSDLPHHLKQCFLYITAFPEGDEIPVRDLINLWTCEGFITELTDRESEEEAADRYINELVRRSLVQVAKRRTDKGIKQIFVHTAIRELCIIKSTNEKFLHIHRYPHSLFPSDSVRRLAIYNITKITNIQNPRPPSSNSYPALHSILCFDKQQLNQRDFLPSLVYKYYKYLRVLDIGFVVLTHEVIPAELGYLYHLRYIRINAPRAKSLPPSITNLLNLQTFDSRHSVITSMLGEGIWKIQNLRHLYLGGFNDIQNGATKSFFLCNLQSLFNVHLNEGNRDRFFASMPNLIKLGIDGRMRDGANCSSPSKADCLSSPHYLAHLKTLKVVSYSVFPESLLNLSSLSNLKKITIRESTLSYSNMLILGKLRNLEIMKLQKVKFPQREMVCEAGTFQKLELLHLLEMDFENWELSIDAMAGLSTVVIDRPLANFLESFRFPCPRRDIINFVMKHQLQLEGSSS